MAATVYWRETPLTLVIIKLNLDSHSSKDLCSPKATRSRYPSNSSTGPTEQASIWLRIY